MNKILLSLCLITALMTGCSKHEEPVQSQQIGTTKEPTEIELAKAKEELIKANPALAPATNNLTPEEAKQAAQRTYENALNEEAFINNAFKLKDKNTLDNYVMHPKDSMFPNDERAFPYGSCEVVFSDVQNLASVMAVNLKEDNALNKRMYKEHQENLDESKQECLRLLRMSFSEVEKEYEDS